MVIGLSQEKKHIIKAKKIAWSKFVSLLDHRTSKNFMWSFAKKMLGKSNAQGPSTSAILLPSGDTALIPEDKCRAFLEYFNVTSQINHVPDAQLHTVIQEGIDCTTANPLNCELTSAELNRILSKRQRSKAMGTDLIHNEMLARLSSPNR